MRTNSGILNAFRIAIATMAALVLSTPDLFSQDKAAIYKPTMEAAKDSLPKVRSASGTVQIPQVYSPNAANLGTYGKIPADLYHGLANVSIPLDSVVAKGYTLPIYLTYNTMGNRPEVHPGWVGQGWTLHAGGCIVRQVNDLPDDITKEEFYAYYPRYDENGFPVYNNINPGYLYHCSRIQSEAWDQPATLGNYSRAMKFGLRYDIGPDEYQICLDDINASFYITGYNQTTGDCDIVISSKSSGSFKVKFQVQSPLGHSIKHLYQNILPQSQREVIVYSHITGMIVTKDNGVKYYFGGDDSAQEYSFVTTKPGQSYVMTDLRASVNTWYLTKIEFPYGEEIYFSYQHDGMPIVKSDNHYSYYWDIFPIPDGMSMPFDTKDLLHSNLENVNFSFLQPCYLTGISCKLSESYLTFSRTQTRELRYDIAPQEFYRRAIDISGMTFNDFMGQSYYMQLDCISGPGHDIVFSYSGNDNMRLHLNEIKFTSFGAVDRSYRMEYNQTLLPGYNSKMTDAWGYYNGRYYGDAAYSELDLIRTVNPSLIQAEMLTNLTYPTGGQLQLEYEPNEYSIIADPYNVQPLNPSTGFGGGLRVKSMTDYDSYSRLYEIRQFKYKYDDGTSSGVLSGKPIFSAVGYANASQWLCGYVITDENMINQIPTDNGSYVTYERAEEIFPDGSKTVTEYNGLIEYPNQMPYYDASISSHNDARITNPVTSLALSRGYARTISHYSPNSALIRQESFGYNYDPGMWIWKPYWSDVCGGVLWRICAPIQYYYQPYMSSHVTREYPADGTIPFIQNEMYDYEPVTRLPRSTTRTVGDRTESNYISYSYSINTGIYSTMVSEGFTGIPVEIRHFVNGRLTGSELTTYMRNTMNDDFVPSAVYTLKLAEPVLSSSIPAYSGGSVNSAFGIAELSFISYDCYSNPLEVKGRTIPDKVYYWNVGQNMPSAIFEGTSSYEGNILFQNFGGYSHTGSYTVTRPATYAPRYLDYQVLRNGKWEYVHHDFTGTTYTIDEGTDPIRDIRVYPYNTLANSYAYSINGELLRTTDARGATTYYDYDGFGRLTGIRDNEGNEVESDEYAYDTVVSDFDIRANKVLTRTYLSADGMEHRDNVTLLDGLGRKARQIAVEASPNDGLDIISATTYDSNGRPYFDVLPAATGYITASMDIDFIVMDAQTEYGDFLPITKHTYNAYPYSTRNSDTGPGWQWYDVRYNEKEFLVNDNFVERLSCQHYAVSFNGNSVTMTDEGIYPSGTIKVIKATNEDNQVAYEFKDMDDNVVLQRMVGESGEFRDTYYLYDGMNRLSAVLQPELSHIFYQNSSIASIPDVEDRFMEYAFLYRYDKYGQCIAKHIPGAGWDTYAYDLRGTMVFSQTAVQREEHRASFFLHDNLLRECLSGIQQCTDLPLVSGFTITAMPRVTPDMPDTFGYYINYNFIDSGTRILTVNHYDNYGFLGANGFPVSGNSYVVKDRRPVAGSYGAESSCTPMGLQTGSLNAILDSSSMNYQIDYIWNVNYYDDRARVIQQRSNTHIDGRYETASTCYDFVGNVTRKTLWHDNGQSRSTEVYDYTYDNWQRPLVTTHSVDGATAVTIADNSYDAIGRLISTKRAGNPNLATSVQYNVRSLPTQYGGPLFSETLHYIDSSAPQYGGNVSAIEWNHGSNAPLYGYLYVYDALGRLISATGSGAAASHSESYAYDRQYNVTSATRNGVTTQYGYRGNRQIAIGSNTCTYDSDGRLKTDASSQLIATGYNFLNLPESRVYGPDNAVSSYISNFGTTYSSSGTKLIETLSEGGVISYRKDYVGNLVFKDGNLDKTIIEGGYIDSLNRYHFLLKDHLGNVRADVLTDGTVVSAYDYYPYGDTFVAASPTAGQPYRFSGNEIDPFGTYDFIARQYAPSTGRFTTIDPLAEKYYSFSPYAYCAGNPVNLEDPEGEGPIWDMLNVVMDVKSLYENVTAGNYAGAALDAVGLAYDLFAVATPAPGGAGTLIKASRAGKIIDTAVDVVTDKNFRTFTSGNFRHNLGKYTNVIPEAGYEAHHMLPQKFRDKFEAMGINIHNPKFGSWEEATTHRKISYEYNKKWETFFDKNKDIVLTEDEALQKAGQFMQEVMSNIQ